MSEQRAGLKWISNLVRRADRRYCTYKPLLQINLLFVEIIFTHRGVAEATGVVLFSAVWWAEAELQTTKKNREDENVAKLVHFNSYQGLILWCYVQNWTSASLSQQQHVHKLNLDFVSTEIAKNVGTVFIKIASMALCLKLESSVKNFFIGFVCMLVLHVYVFQMHWVCQNLNLIS